ncbi:MAG: hypothetical protein K2I73_04705, partial [Eubacterium sp.]|nr:hypothetical protein [Eubacterium sp.]
KRMAIGKIDYYVGALLSYLIKKKITPAIFDNSDHYKIVTFETNERKFNLFVKYSAKPVSQNKTSNRWDITFTTSEYEILKNSYPKGEYENLVVLVCSTEKFSQTEIAVLKLKQVFKCLGNDNVNQNRKISVKSEKGSKYLRCYGTAVSSDNSLQITRNVDKQF